MSVRGLVYHSLQILIIIQHYASITLFTRNYQVRFLTCFHNALEHYFDQFPSKMIKAHATRILIKNINHNNGY